MKLSHKLILGYLLVASLASFTTYFALHSYQNIDESFKNLMSEPVPMIKSLEAIKDAGFHIISSTGEICFILSLSTNSNKNGLAEEEQQLIDGLKKYREALKHYEELINTHNSSEIKFLEVIKKHGNDLIQTSEQIIAMSRKRITGEEILEKRKIFEAQERVFLQSIDNALLNEYGELTNAQETVQATIARATDRTLLFTFFTFMLAIISGLYISRHISNRINKLKEASEKVGQGQLETIIEIKTNDEIGALARSLNKMVGDLKKSGVELMLSKNFVDNIINSIADVLFVLDTDLKIIRLNQAAIDLTGFSKDELIGHSIKMLRNDTEFFNDQDVEELQAKSCVSGIETFWQAKDSRIIPILFSASIIHDSKGEASGIVCVAQDISERKKIESTLRHNEEKYRELIENANDVVYTLDLSGGFTSLNRAGEQKTGYTRAEALHMSIGEVVGKEDLERIGQRIAKNLAGEVQPNIELEINAKDGSKVMLDISSRLIYQDGAVVGIQGIGRDITERKRAEKEQARLNEQIENQRQRLDTIIANVQGVIWETRINPDDPPNRLDFVSDYVVTMLGYSVEEFTSTPDFWLSIIHPEDRERTLREVKELYKSKQSGTLEFRWITKDGRVIWIESRDEIICNEKGKQIGMRGVTIDITERRQAEEKLRIFNGKLQQSNRELQDFAYVASHDLQEPLRKVQAFADRLNSKYADVLTGSGLDYLERMRNAAQRMQTLIQDLLTFSRVTTKAKPFVPVNLEKVTREVLSDLEVSIEQSGATIEIDDLPEIDADPTQMRQLMQNLIGNALKFHHKDTSPFIKISAQTSENHSNDNGNGRLCEIMVRDNGIGFDEKYLDRIFTVFQRLHGRTDYEGSGVGLAVCRKIAERHHGTITAESSPDKGSTFIVVLPFKQLNEELN